MKVLGRGCIRRGRVAYDNQVAFEDEIAQFGAGEEVLVTVESLHASVSREARGYYFGVVLKHLATYSGHSIDDLQAKFTPKHLTLLDGNGRVVDDLVIGSTTTTFDPQQFFEYVEQLRGFMAQELGIVTPDPDQAWREKRGHAA